MREIKFRAYNKDWKMMALPEDIISLNVDGVTNCLVDVDFLITTTDGEKHSQLWEDDPDIVLMQYTGLKDKNGVEIYEGDVVKYQKTFPNSGNPITKIYQYEIKWYEDLDIYGGSDLLNGVGFRNVHSNLEVIGNIYENPELLTNETTQ